MIAAANRDIRRQLRLAELRRAQEANSPFAYLDRFIEELELMHLDGLRRLPLSVVPAIRTVNRLLPDGVEPLPEQRVAIRDTIDRCFDLQERLLNLRDGRLLGLPADEGEGGPDVINNGDLLPASD
jgi:hypothetical protein